MSKKANKKKKVKANDSCRMVSVREPVYDYVKDIHEKDDRSMRSIFDEMQSIHQSVRKVAETQGKSVNATYEDMVNQYVAD